MIFISESHHNINLGAPVEWDEEKQGQCMTITAYKHPEKENCFYDVAVLPSREDIEAIVAGRPIHLRVHSSSFPPVAVWTVNEHGQPNDD